MAATGGRFLCCQVAKTTMQTGSDSNCASEVHDLWSQVTGRGFSMCGEVAKTKLERSINDDPEHDTDSG